ncbi:MAG: hypothetical protein KTR31_09420 [Myxococcales bacterium]|nr:hypothetical protein [Myxococcales bacterium]
MSTPPQLHLHVVWRPETQRAVILLRRSRRFATFGWNRATDAITIGQWCKHKIYLRRCDLSVDGALWGYFALDGNWQSAAKGSFSVIARPPYLKALVLFPQGDTWGGGVGFPDAGDRFVQIGTGTRHPYTLTPRFSDLLQRSGWTAGDDAYHKRVSRRWTLHKHLPQYPNQPEGHALVAADGEVVELPHWRWADVFPKRDRIVYSVAGQLLSVPRTAPFDTPDVLLDVTEERFRNLRAPYDDETVFARHHGPEVLQVRPWSGT